MTFCFRNVKIFRLAVQLTGYFQYKQLYQYIRDLFEAGSGTTANTLIWALLCLIHYPEVQTKLRKEINNVIGTYDYFYDEEFAYCLMFILLFRCCKLESVRFFNVRNIVRFLSDESFSDRRVSNFSMLRLLLHSFNYSSAWRFFENLTTYISVSIYKLLLAIYIEAVIVTYATRSYYRLATCDIILYLQLTHFFQQCLT